jgi:hypothetical protein
VQLGPPEHDEAARLRYLAPAQIYEPGGARPGYRLAPEIQLVAGLDHLDTDVEHRRLGVAG